MAISSTRSACFALRHIRYLLSGVRSRIIENRDYKADTERLGEAIRRAYTQEWFWDIQAIIFMLQGMYREALASYAKMRELHSWQFCFLPFWVMKTGEPERAATILKAFKPGSYGLGPSGLMDAVLPDIDPDFRTQAATSPARLESRVSARCRRGPSVDGRAAGCGLRG